MGTQDDLYVIAGVSLRRFVADWLSDLESGGGQMRGLLDEAQSGREPGDDYFFSTSFLMANVAPHAVPLTASPEVLLLCAVLFLYQQAELPNSQKTWDGFDAHISRAFDHLHEIGEKAAAKALIQDVLRRMEPGPEAYEEMARRRREKDPSKSAAHERDMAFLRQRYLRAAKLLDPDADFDRELVQHVMEQ